MGTVFQSDYVPFQTLGLTYQVLTKRGGYQMWETVAAFNALMMDDSSCSHLTEASHIPTDFPFFMFRPWFG